MQHSKRMRRNMSSVASMTLQSFSTLSHKRHVFEGKKKKRVTENKMNIWIFSEDFSKKFPILRITEPRIIITVHRS